MTLVALAVAAAFGALARYGVDSAIGTRGSFPLGIFVVNVAGSFALGLLLAATTDRWLRMTVGVGFLGAFTTFSTFAFQSWSLLDEGKVAVGIANLAASCAAGLGAVWLGIVLGRAL